MLVGGVCLEGMEEGFRSPFYGQGFVIKGTGVWRRGARAEGESGKRATEMNKPGFEDAWRHEVDLIEDKDEAFGAGVGGHDLLFYFSGAGTVGVAGVEDVKDDVGGGEDRFVSFVESAARGVVWLCDADCGFEVEVLGRIVVFHAVVVFILIGCFLILILDCTGFCGRK